MSIGVRAIIGSMAVMSVACAVDNPAVSSGRNDVVYLAPARDYYEAMPLGNGQVGVMLRNATGIDCLFDHASFFADATEQQLLHSSGEVHVRLPKAWLDGWREQRLKLWDGEIETVLDAARLRTWFAEGTDVLVVEVDSDQVLPEIRVELELWDRSATPPVLPVTPAAGAHDAALTTMGLSQHRAVTLLATDLAGRATASVAGPLAASLVVPGGEKRAVVLIANPCTVATGVTPDSSLAAARAMVERVRQEGLDTFRRQRLDFWHGFWSRSSVRLESSDGTAEYAEDLYNLFLFCMAGQARGADAPKFNGGLYRLYRDLRDWGGYYWYQNTRELYWALLPAGHPEFMQGFIDLYVRNLPAMRRLAAESYKAPGACVNETMGRLGDGDKPGNPYTHLYHTTGTEVAHQLYMYYLYTGDEAFLRGTCYPFMKETVAFHLRFFHKETDGLYHIYPSNVRETWWFVKDSVTDLVAIRAVLPILIQVSERLNVDAADREHWLDVLVHLAPYPAARDSGLLQPGVLFDEFPPHDLPHADRIYPMEKRSLRSKGNVFNCENVTCEPLYPWGLTGLDSAPDQLDLMRRTFRARPHRNWGFGNAWDPSAIWAARLGLVEDATKLLRDYMEQVQMCPAGFAGTPGGRMAMWGKALANNTAWDSAGVFAAAIQEMLLQSFGGRIRVFPCWPPGWAGEFTLMAEGGFQVTSRVLPDGRVHAVGVRSERGGACRVVNPWSGPASLDGVSVAGAVIEFPTEPGRSYRLDPGALAQDIPLPAPVRNDGPKWPYHVKAEDTFEAYLARARGYASLGISRGGMSTQRLNVLRALSEAPAPTAAIPRLPQPVYVVPRVPAPTIDGRLDDPAWQKRTPFGPFVNLATGSAAVEQTEFLAGWDEQCLYIAGRCLSQDMTKMVAAPDLAETDPALFRSDAIELFLQPAADSPYWQFVVNAGGSRYDARVDLSGPATADVAASLGARVAVGRTDKAWTFEAAIPFAALGGAPQPGAVWRFNAGRDGSVLRETSSWAPIATPNFHKPKEFGCLRWGGPDADLAPVVSLDLTDGHIPGRVEGRVDVAEADGARALHFVNGYVEFAHQTEFTLEDAVTLSVWVNPENEGARLIDKTPVGKDSGYLLDLHPGNRVRFITPFGTIGTEQPVAKGQWTHVAAVASWSGGFLRLFVNGQKAAEATFSRPSWSWTALPLRLGADSQGSSRFVGLMKEVKVWRRALAPDEIGQLSARP